MTEPYLTDDADGTILFGPANVYWTKYVHIRVHRVPIPEALAELPRIVVRDALARACPGERGLWSRMH